MPARSSRTRAAAVVAAFLVVLIALLNQSGAAAADTVRADTVPAGSSVQAAWNWINSQQGTGTAVTTASVITPAQNYPASWTGPVAGTFQLAGVSPPVVDQPSIVVDSPAVVPGDQAPIIQGHITFTPEPFRWIVQVYRDTAAGSSQVPLQALVQPDGTFTVDLGAAPAQPPGTWALGLLDAQNAYAPTGNNWPDPGQYSDLEVRALVSTDTTYLIASEPASADNTFAFTTSEPGTKIFQLVDDSTGAVLAESAPNFGLVRSFAGGDVTYTYDQALAVATGVALGQDTHLLAAGLLTLQNSDGSFVDSATTLNPAVSAEVVRTGVSAVATYALLRVLQVLAPGDPSAPAVRAGAEAGVAWLLGEQLPGGLVAPGRGDYNTDGTVDPDALPSGISTEHNLDAWQTLNLAASVLSDRNAADAADILASQIVAQLWSPADGRFLQGIDVTGPDQGDPLDVNTWGAMFLHSIGRDDLAEQALAHTAAFASAVGALSGYRAWYPQPAFPEAIENVWTEGTAQVALAQEYLDDQAGQAVTLAALAPIQASDGSFQCAAVSDAATSMTQASCVAGTAWFILATTAGTTDLGLWS